MKIIKRILLMMFVLCFLFALVFVGVNIYVRAYSSRYFLSADAVNSEYDFDCIVVLGAGVRDDGSPSLMLGSRLDAAINLYENGVADTFLLSGDHGRKNYDEVNNMMRYILDNSDVEKKRVFLDHAGFSTYETACRAKAVFTVEKGIFVSQKYHLYRIVYNSRKKGIDAYGYYSDDLSWPGMTYYKLRESIAIFKDFFCCLFNVPPTYLGEQIPITEDAFATHDISA